MHLKKLALGGLSLLVLAAIFIFGNTEDPNIGKRFETRLQGWQTYCATEKNTIHKWTKTDGDVRFEQLGRASEKIRTTYLFTQDAALQIRDKANEEQFSLEANHFVSVDRTVCPKFSAIGHSFDYSSEDNLVLACAENEECKSIKIHPGTFVYAYAEANGAVLAATNYGDMLLFRDGDWCRMSKERETYSCKRSQEPEVSEPSIQLYSSVQFDGKTLLGEYPTGRLFEFDGKSLWPSSISPPQFRGGKIIEFEAQGLASYCGDLYVGYWPMGQVIRFDGRRWHEPIDLFNLDNERSGKFPYEDIARSSGETSNFFGRRVPSFALSGGDLYAITSNKNNWTEEKNIDLPEDFENEYGVLWKFSKEGCNAVTEISDEKT